MKTKKCKSFQKEMRNFQNMAFTYVLPTQKNDLFKAQTSPSTTSLPNSLFNRNTTQQGSFTILTVPVPSFKFLFHILLFILTIYNPISSSIKYIPNILSFGLGQYKRTVLPHLSGNLNCTTKQSQGLETEMGRGEEVPRNSMR